MPKVKQETIERTQVILNDLMSSPSFPYAEDLLKSNRVLCKTIDNIKVQTNDIPDKTLFSLIVKSLDIGEVITGEALWKRYRRGYANRDTSDVNSATLNENKDTSTIDTDATVCKEYRGMNSNRDGLGVNGAGSDTNSDTTCSLSIPPETSQKDLAVALGVFFVSQGYPPASLLKTCLMAIQTMSAEMNASSIKDVTNSLCDELEIPDNASQSQ